MPRIRWQFSLRTMLLVLGLVSLGCYYYLALPSQNAEKLRRSLEAADYDAVDVLFAQEEQESPLPRTHWTKRPIQGNEWDVIMQPLTWEETFGGRRDIFVSVFLLSSGMTTDFWIMVRATPRGVKVIQD